MTSTYVSIGRNIGDEPMAADLWRDFIADVEVNVTDWIGPIVTTAEGRGYWVGGSEDTAVIVAKGTPIEGFRNVLASLARRYGQEAIALAVAEVDFVKGTEVKMPNAWQVVDSIVLPKERGGTYTVTLEHAPKLWAVRNGPRSSALFETEREARAFFETFMKEKDQ